CAPQEHSSRTGWHRRPLEMCHWLSTKAIRRLPTRPVARLRSRLTSRNSVRKIVASPNRKRSAPPRGAKAYLAPIDRRCVWSWTRNTFSVAAPPANDGRWLTLKRRWQGRAFWCRLTRDLMLSLKEIHFPIYI